MADHKRDIAIALCLETSEKGATKKPLSIAEFYELLAAFRKHNGESTEPVQMSLFDEAPLGHLDLASLLDLEIDFLTKQLGLKDDLVKKIFLLLERINSLAFELEKLENSGINVCTIFDSDYPAKLKSGLKEQPNSLREPPILYCCGDLSIANFDFAGFVGSRDANEEDNVWTQKIINSIHTKAQRNQQVFGVVSGGAEGIDRLSEDTAVALSMPVIEFSKNMRSTLKEPSYLDAITHGGMLLLSEVNPLRNLSRLEATAHFMNRNKYIYATGKFTIVVKSSLGTKSGTWAGAAEALKRNIGTVYVRDVPCDGNQDLIQKGALPFS